MILSMLVQSTPIPNATVQIITRNVVLHIVDCTKIVSLTASSVPFENASTNQYCGIDTGAPIGSTNSSPSTFSNNRKICPQSIGHWQKTIVRLNDVLCLFKDIAKGINTSSIELI